MRINHVVFSIKFTQPLGKTALRFCNTQKLAIEWMKTTEIKRAMAGLIIGKLREAEILLSQRRNDQKVLYLVMRNLPTNWRMAPRAWASAMNQFAILFDDPRQAVGR